MSRYVLRSQNGIFCCKFSFKYIYFLIDVFSIALVWQISELGIAHPWSCASRRIIQLWCLFLRIFACSSIVNKYRFCTGGIHCRLTLVLTEKKCMSSPKKKCMCICNPFSSVNSSNFLICSIHHIFNSVLWKVSLFSIFRLCLLQVFYLPHELHMEIGNDRGFVKLRDIAG
jgi:hypothetical protein